MKLIITLTLDPETAEEYRDVHPDIIRDDLLRTSYETSLLRCGSVEVRKEESRIP